MRRHVSIFYGLTACLWFVSLSPVQAATNIGIPGTVEFSATITARSCDITFDAQKALNFAPLPPTPQKNYMTLEILPYSFDVSCNYSGTPKLVVTGNTPYVGDNHVFLDANAAFPVGQGNGFGVMVHPATKTSEVTTPPAISDFYINGKAGKAVSNGEETSLTSLTSANANTAKQVLWLGLVTLPTDTEKAFYGKFTSTLTLKVTVP